MPTEAVLPRGALNESVGYQASAVSEDVFRLLSDVAPVLMWLTDSRGKCSWVNQTWLDLTGRMMSDELGDGWTDLIHPDDLDHCVEIFNDAFIKRHDFEIEYRIRRYDEQYRWVIDRGVPLKDLEGRFQGFGGVAMDITDRVAAEEISARYRLLAERSSDVIWFTRPNGHFYDVNKAAVETYGYSRDEFLTMNVRDVRHRSTHSILDNQLADANNEGVSFETLHVRKDGTSFPVEVKANATDFGGQRLIMSIVRDVTERKQHETALRESEERRQLAQEAGNVGIFDWDRAQNKTYWSEMMWLLYGEEPGQVDPDESFWSLHLHEHDRERVKLNIRNSFDSDALQFRDEFRIVRKDGSVRWIESAAKLQRDSAGKAERMYGVNLDITDRKESEQRLRLSENQLRLVMNTVPALISYVDRDQRYRFVNGKLTEWFAKPVDQLIGRKVRDIIGTNAYRMLKPHIDEAFSGKDSAFDSQVHYKTVGPRYVHGSLVPD
ncbi:MAG: PAS domain S-box protein, partial [Pyrinomonadaceae bacterium]